MRELTPLARGPTVQILIHFHRDLYGFIRISIYIYITVYIYIIYYIYILYYIYYIIYIYYIYMNI